MKNEKNIEKVLAQIKDPAVKLLAEHSLKIARHALDNKSGASRDSYIVDEIDKIMPKALKRRFKNETE